MQSILAVDGHTECLSAQPEWLRVFLGISTTEDTEVTEGFLGRFFAFIRQAPIKRKPLCFSVSSVVMVFLHAPSI